MANDQDQGGGGEGLGAVPLATLCEAAGINQSLVQDLYSEVVNEDPETIEVRDGQLDEDEENDGAHLVAVAEAELDAAFVAAAEEEAADQPSGSEMSPLVANRPVETPLPPPPRRRRHVRDVSEDFAAQALQAIHAPDEAEDATEKGMPPKPAHRHAHPLVPMSGKPPALAIHRRSKSAFAYGSGQKTSAAEYRANLLGNLMQRNDSFKAAPPAAAAAKTAKPVHTRSASISLRDLLVPSESFRKVHMPAEGAPQPARLRTRTWDHAPKPLTEDPATAHRASFVILDTASEMPQPARRRHKRAHTSIGSGFELASSASQPASGPDAAEQGHRRRKSFLPDALVAPLERGMSMLPTMPAIPTSLPSDVDEVNLTIDVKEGAKGKVEDVDVLLVVKRSVPFIGYALLAGACLCLSTTGAVLDKQQGVTPTLKAYWRMCATWLTLLPLALKAVLGHGGGVPKLTKYEWSLFLWCGLGYAACAEFFVLALSLTSVMNVFIFANMHCLLFVVLKVLTRAPISCKEGMGAVIGFIGGIVCALGGKSGSDDAPSDDQSTRFLEVEVDATGAGVPTYVGCLVAMVSACGTVLYLSVAKRLRPRCDVRVYIFLQFFVASWWLLAMMLAKGEYFTLSSDPHYGLWGWVIPRLDRLVTEIWLVFICNIGGVFGYILAMKYFEPLVISCCQNVNPILSSIFSVILGVDPPPTPIALFGDAVVFSGTYMVISSEAKKTEVTDVKEVARERGYTAADDDIELKQK